MTHQHYILDRDRNPVPVDLMTWARWFEKSNQRRVASTRLGTAHVSTVFLGLNHRYGPGAPVLYETMIFDKTRDHGYMERYETDEQARAGHRRAVDHVAQLLRKASVSSTSRNAREGRYLARFARARA
jgi:hypothetical protein